MGARADPAPAGPGERLPGADRRRTPHPAVPRQVDGSALPDAGPGEAVIDLDGAGSGRVNLVRAELERLSARRFVQLMVVLLADRVRGHRGDHAGRLAPAHAGRAEPGPGAGRRGSGSSMEAAHDQQCLADRAGTLAPERERLPPRGLRARSTRSGMERLPIAADYLQRRVHLRRAGRAAALLPHRVPGALRVPGRRLLHRRRPELRRGGEPAALAAPPVDGARRQAGHAARRGCWCSPLLASVAYLGRVLADRADRRAAGPAGRRLLAVAGRDVRAGAGAGAAGRARWASRSPRWAGTPSAALGTVAAYLVVWELGARLVLEIVEAARPDRWMLSSYVGGLAHRRGAVLGQPAPACGDTSGFCDGFYTPELGARRWWCCSVLTGGAGRWRRSPRSAAAT